MNSLRRNLLHAARAFACAVAGTVALTAPGAALAQDDGGKVETFKDWRVRCAAMPASDNQRRCFMVQIVNLTDDKGENSVPVLSVVVMRSDDKKNTRMVLTLPLGVRLPLGIAVKVDEGKEYGAPYQMCARDGCRSVLDLDSQFVQAMRRGKLARIAFADAQGKQGIIPVSLSGFTAAYNRLANRRP